MTPELIREYERHCQVIDENKWSRNERRQLKKDLKAILIRDGQINPNALTPAYRWNLCSTRLRDGDFSNWDGWEFRSDWAMTFRWGQDVKSPVPKWNGGPCDHLVILGEQGIGDEILFASALPELIIRVGPKNIEFQTYPRLIPIIERSFKIKCAPRRGLSEVKEGKAIVALGDLFPFYRRDQIHFPRKPYLKPDLEKVEHWKAWLSQFPKPWVGSSWFSRHGYLNPKDLKGDGTYFNLQYGQDSPEGFIKPPFDTKDDFENLFAFVYSLDKVISVTQTLVHISGSLGKETEAIIPPKNGEVSWHLWYYFNGGESKIYPNMTVYKNIDDFHKARSG